MDHHRVKLTAVVGERSSLSLQVQAAISEIDVVLPDSPTDAAELLAKGDRRLCCDREMLEMKSPGW